MVWTCYIPRNELGLAGISPASCLTEHTNTNTLAPRKYLGSPLYDNNNQLVYHTHSKNITQMMTRYWCEKVRIILRCIPNQFVVKNKQICYCNKNLPRLNFLPGATNECAEGFKKVTDAFGRHPLPKAYFTWWHLSTCQEFCLIQFQIRSIQHSLNHRGCNMLRPRTPETQACIPFRPEYMLLFASSIVQLEELEQEM